MRATLTHYESRLAHRVYLGGLHVGTVEVVKRHDGMDRALKIRGWCSECMCDVDAQGGNVDDDDRSNARYHATPDACAEAVGKHALKCDEMIAEMAKHARTVAA